MTIGFVGGSSPWRKRPQHRI